MELYRKYRPKNLKQIIGQDITVRTLESLIENNNIPHFIMFTGPRGCGKTTLARIMRRKLKCSKYDFVEIAPRKVEAVREIKSRINLAAVKGECRIFLIEECHKLTPDAQTEFLIMLDDTPNHIYFLFTTTDPQKMSPPLMDRSTEIIVKPLNEKNLTKLIKYVCKEERTKISEEVIEKIVDNSNGSARKALVFLNGVINLKTKSEQLNAIVTSTAEIQAIAIARALFNPKTKWLTMAKILKETEMGEEAEQIRWMVLGYSKTIILSGGKLSGRAYIIISAFGDNFYDSKWAGLAAAAWEIIEGTK